ncbi:hypothetical protein BKA56DRAFT_581741 [Ilyonectria sp. MPI-CAGE-AT-0026]|nr:hypothetical protein BKA56DRAFT_581741 [Ilyonectria sp. MPI-CAGE-AT-0026]
MANADDSNIRIFARFLFAAHFASVSQSLSTMHLPCCVVSHSVWRRFGDSARHFLRKACSPGPRPLLAPHLAPQGQETPFSPRCGLNRRHGSLPVGGVVGNPPSSLPLGIASAIPFRPPDTSSHGAIPCSAPVPLLALRGGIIALSEQYHGRAFHSHGWRGRCTVYRVLWTWDSMPLAGHGPWGHGDCCVSFGPRGDPASISGDRV